MRQTFKWTRPDSANPADNIPFWLQDLVKRELVRPDHDECRLWVNTPGGGATDCYKGDTIVYVVDGNREFLTVLPTSLGPVTDIDTDRVTLSPIADRETLRALDTLGHWLKVNRHQGSPLARFGKSRVEHVLSELADLKNWLVR